MSFRSVVTWFIPFLLLVVLCGFTGSRTANGWPEKFTYEVTFEEEAAPKPQLDGIQHFEIVEHQSEFSGGRPQMTYEPRASPQGHRRLRHGGHSTEKKHLREALALWKETCRAAVCQPPVPQVVRVEDVHPHAISDRYITTCVILHRCQGFQGCHLRDAAKFCGPTAGSTHLVELPIVVARTSVRYRGSRSVVVGLSFENHTACSFVNKADLPHEATTFARLPDNRTFCECPESFVERQRSGNNGCFCDCFYNDDECIERMQGVRELSVTAHHCVEFGRCGNSQFCRYGAYLTSERRCPTWSEVRTDRVQERGGQITRSLLKQQYLFDRPHSEVWNNEI
ncbi:unnamed protein product [Cyprideis torosa]|uniref:Uncharacterized protein n=1 Tax=Cyprideis torosa TaxID=163714 RepID=A0A7R8W206_9CRUS|nr:unnamed protein product [Cyprideis torosa]CAG0880446.1 unnamed protein product [Cyprideis torosa]